MRRQNHSCQQLPYKIIKLGLLLSGAIALQAHAQTNVDIYGNLDVSLGKESGQSVAMGRGYNNWLGFKGQEDLGNGLSATFHLQTRFIPATGEQERSTTFFQGESTVGLKSNTLGSVRLGRAITPLWNHIWLFEPWYNSGFNGSLASYQTGSYSSDGINDVALGYANFSRIGSSVFYDSPNLSGFRLVMAGKVEKSPFAKTRNVGMTLHYAKDALAALASYERNDNNDRIYFLSSSYTFSKLAIMGSYAQTKLVGTNAVAAGRSKERLMLLAATYAIGTDTIKTGYGRHQDNGNHKVSLGYSHRLSKRTALYADVYREKIVANKNGYAIGMSHTF